MSLDLGSRDAIDKDLCRAETLVQVSDRGKLIADLDVLPFFDPKNDLVRRSRIRCGGCLQSSRRPPHLKSVDHCEELDAAKSWTLEHVGVFKAYDNWSVQVDVAWFCL